MVVCYRKHMLRFYKGDKMFLAKFIPGPFVVLLFVVLLFGVLLYGSFFSGPSFPRCKRARGEGGLAMLPALPW